MIEYLLPVGFAAVIAIEQYLSDKKSEREFYEACEGNKRAFDNVSSVLNNPENTSKLVDLLK